MYSYKIINLIKKNGKADYKGLNVNDIIPGTQIYDTVIMNECVLKSSEDLPQGTELLKLTDEEYEIEKNAILQRQPIPKTSEQKIAELQETIDALAFEILELKKLI